MRLKKDQIRANASAQEKPNTPRTEQQINTANDPVGRELLDRLRERNALPDVAQEAKVLSINQGNHTVPPPPVFRTKEDIRKLTFAELEQAVNNTKDINLLRMADEFIEEARAKVQSRIKYLSWGNADLPGELRFNEVIKVKTLSDNTDKSYGYLKVSCSNLTKNIRPLTDDEMARLLDRQEEDRQFISRISKSTRGISK